MSTCIAIFENELERVVEELDNTKFKYKFLFDSDEKYKTIERYNLDVLQDALLFSGLGNKINSNRYKKPGPEMEKAWSEFVHDVFSEGRQITIVNDFIDYPDLVIVFPTIFQDTTQRVNTVTLTDDILDYIVKTFIKQFSQEEGMTIIRWDEYGLNINELEPEFNRKMFISKQRQIKANARAEHKIEALRVFREAFKFRMITYYTKLREFGMDDIMRKLDELGFLDERFDSEVYIYEEEARRLLAKRLCAMSYKADIKILIDEGILKESDVPYMKI
jgi:hypothetical protein